MKIPISPLIILIKIGNYSNQMTEELIKNEISSIDIVSSYHSNIEVIFYFYTSEILLVSDKFLVIFEYLGDTSSDFYHLLCAFLIRI